MTKDGRRIDVSVTVSPVKDHDGRIIGASKIIRDITDRKRVEEALARERANLRAVFDVVNVGMLVVDEDGGVKQVNDTRCPLGPQRRNGVGRRATGRLRPLRPCPGRPRRVRTRPHVPFLPHPQGLYHRYCRAGSPSMTWRRRPSSRSTEPK